MYCYTALDFLAFLRPNVLSSTILAFSLLMVFAVGSVALPFFLGGIAKFYTNLIYNLINLSQTKNTFIIKRKEAIKCISQFALNNYISIYK